MPVAGANCGIAGLRAPFVLLEDRSGAGQALLFADPAEIVEASEPAEIAEAFARIKAGLARGLHAAGFLSYELGYAFEPRLAGLLPSEPRLPLLWFGLFEAPRSIVPAELDQEFAARCPAPLGDLAFGLDEAAHAAAVQRVLDYLHAGDAYQVNLTFPIRFRYPGDPLALYGALRASQPVAHGGMVATGEASILSVSPELFIETAGRRAVTRPMKGTAARGFDAPADEVAKASLRADPKQQAENLMIVDLLRNDLSRISEQDSVKVPALFSVETYPGFHTLTSTVTSQLRPGLSLLEQMQALFPCGSVTGAPKLRAMEIIRELEAAPRGIYTGSLGMIAPNGDLSFNVAIRTATLLPGGEGVYGVGGGIVVDSRPAEEYAECRLKARVLTDLAEEYGLIETLRWSGGYVRLALHLERLAASSSVLGFRLDREQVLGQLAAAEAALPAGEERRVRCELRCDGMLQITTAPMPVAAGGAVRIAIARQRVDAGDPFLRHKTTRRAVYERAFAEAALQGCDDALLLNRQGFITETSRSNVFVEHDGVLLTPPLVHGLLPGVLRRELIETGVAREAPLRLDDLRQAGRWFVGNSLRGLQLAEIAGSALASDTPNQK
ncbi:Para-aminobenzoate synthetase / 4-amino-4-deoxychorismate lyase [Bosea sp. 62]|uniref:aminodeoxychorismate synthase component I n=1 Tax=unclassified Bosea (in: a-proteobacteria) TaxID=2653178 RepID=UPI001259ADB8|nr:MULTISPECIES: aminodeoxychorismate synthase component I [unclassified Bosea (in: a-proteobacteria)]CAD5252758.1 Para-aminobenzoate synthetase / 4-amino-4-deoxychorismate lyase [Bosea sp. 7B]CAD5278586.1 Para-aminobenzoate synthetase / 4-amino-4-deoxychorismate lyase [Bosea sp. 21B]CAD5279683.1 Para-aminobenzoate synthetase / 4-amino-4-deoxychorismate lyase [Bosea sp. 46]VVT59636.1 Para-aminobenzoate synthetase / 4-amino-4-deoxychorismate lyase [Bosea sp. EC-HK365B]VXB37249.1 Para-aminobenzo